MWSINFRWIAVRYCDFDILYESSIASRRRLYWTWLITLYSTVVRRCPCPHPSSPPPTLSLSIASFHSVMHQTNFLHTVKFYFDSNGIAIQKFYPFSSSLNVSCCSRSRFFSFFFLFPFTFFGRQTATSYIATQSMRLLRPFWIKICVRRTNLRKL